MSNPLPTSPHPVSPTGDGESVELLSSPRLISNSRTTSTQSVTFASSASPDLPPGAGHRHASDPSTLPLLHPTASGDSVETAVKHHEGIYWRSPISMVLFFLLGLSACIAHHVFYSYLDGDIVGDDTSQQWALRGGTTFAYIAQVGFVSSIAISYTQWLWKTLKTTAVAVSTLDAAFGADASLISLLNPEMLRKIRVGSFLALVIGLVPLASLVPPGTLFVLPSAIQSIGTELVASLDMYGPTQMVRFAHWAYENSTAATDNQYIQFLGPRTLVMRLLSATATLGEILPIPHSVPNSTYGLQFYGPSIRCDEANSSVAAIIDNVRDYDVRENMQGTIINDTNYYYAFVPDLTNAGNTSLQFDGVVPVSQNRLQLEIPQHASNQLWMAYSRYTGALDPSSGLRVTEDHYLVCQLFNASYDIDLAFSAGIQTITDRGTTQLNEVPYPNGYSPMSNELMQQHAYSAVFFAITDLLVGSMSFFLSHDTTTTATNFTQITTSIQYTSLLGSQDLAPFFDSNHPTNLTPSDQRIQDIVLAQNRTLPLLVQELAFNLTTTFLTSSLLSPAIEAQVQITEATNKYAYHAPSLLLSYGLATLATLLSTLLGAYAYYHNGVSHNKTFSAILTATRDKSLTKLFDHEIIGRLPLSRKVRGAMLRFGELRDRSSSLRVRRSTYGFMAVGEGVAWVERSVV